MKIYNTITILYREILPHWEILLPSDSSKGFPKYLIKKSCAAYKNKEIKIYFAGTSW
jgi:hypothetical protein